MITFLAIIDVYLKKYDIMKKKIYSNVEDNVTQIKPSVL